jgi:hypothetical protein
MSMVVNILHLPVQFERQTNVFSDPPWVRQRIEQGSDLREENGAWKWKKNQVRVVLKLTCSFAVLFKQLWVIENEQMLHFESKVCFYSEHS